MNADIHIVGAGVSGGVAAYLLAKGGLDVVITEEDRSIGIPQHCTGIISVKGLEESGFNYSKAILNKAYGVHIYGPRNERITIRKKDVQAYIVDRILLDRIYVGMAERAGAELILGKKVASKEDYLADTVVGADGANSTVARIEGFPPITRYAIGYQEIIESKDITNDNMVSVYLSQRLFPGFFGWVVPIEDGRAICGFGISGGYMVNGRMKKFLERAGIRAQRSVRRFGGVIPLEPRKKNAHNKAVLIGGAGGYSKATSGGGVYFSTISAKTAAECILHQRIHEYDMRMSRHVKELKKHKDVRYMYNMLNDTAIGAVMRIGNLLGVPHYIEKKGDMDYISSLLP